MARSGQDFLLEARDIKLRRSDAFALDISQFAIKKGEVVCVAGANGSGKTTLLDVLVKLLFPDSGTVSLLGKVFSEESIQDRVTLGFVPDDDAWIIPELTAREYFALLKSVYQRSGVGHDMNAWVTSLAQELLFTNFDQQMDSLSHGNKKKVQIIAALIHKPKVLVVDELRNGLDPIAIKKAESLLRKQAKNGVAILAATHDLWWAERFSDKVVMLRGGSIILEEATKKIVKQSGSVEARFMELFNER